MEARYRISELAKRAKCQVVTVRYYEKEGLLPVPGRSEGNFRLYEQQHLERLLFIRRCRSLDMQAPSPMSESDWREREIDWRAIRRAGEILSGGEVHPGDIFLPGR